MKKIWIAIGIVFAAALLIGINIYRSVQTSGGENGAMEIVSLQEKEITSTVMVPGTLMFANEQYEYEDPDKGKIAEVKVKEGDRVKKGDVLFTYSNEEMALEKKQNDLSIESKELQLEQIQKKISQLAAKEKDLKAQLGAKAAEKQIDEERDQLEMEKQTAQLELKQALLQKETLQKKMAAFDVKSEIDGTVITADKEAAGKKTDTRRPIIHIGNDNKLVVRGVLSEYDVLKVKKGQNVTITSDVIPDKEWRGRVSAVGLAPEQQEAAGTQTGKEENAVKYPFEVKVRGKLFQAKPGFKMIMNIQTDKRTVQVLPSGAVKQEGGESFVFAVKEGKTKKTKVKTGEKTDGEFEITAGLTKEDQIIANPDDDLKSGTEVKLK
ncbi:efflux RND transporter periplasmic adaptor subunit [Bacillus sonorensis]|uniref:efflux RND transporter periplasmic adaptor subunit n=1 Tax=Bacillus sonorensis TaxID=119858 RepID=UPI00227F51EF|nr:efflux RND transporter periplasmic adaptor subunit [Bacillus sonorensis]MCY8032296.1 efflux RND transporter periplasmic adaptor subunit [Bacillus sonorensis]